MANVYSDFTYVPAILWFKIPFISTTNESLVVEDTYKLVIISEQANSNDGTYILPSRAEFELDLTNPVIRLNIAQYNGIIPPYKGFLYRGKLLVSKFRILLQRPYNSILSPIYYTAIQELKSEELVVKLPYDIHTLIGVTPDDPYTINWQTLTLTFTGAPRLHTIKYRRGVLLRQEVFV